ncbi:Glu/Leu/Phe/Val dehydrogenase, partial [Paraburkholderia sp. SIMBA_027]
AKVIAAQDHTGTVHNAAGLDVHKLLSHVSQHGGVGGFSGGQAMDKNEFWTLETEFVIPAALDSQITADNAAKVRAKIVVEGANGP